MEFLKKVNFCLISVLKLCVGAASGAIKASFAMSEKLTFERSAYVTIEA